MDSDKTSAGAGADGVSTAAGADAVGAALDGASVASVNAASAALDSAGAAGAASTGTGAASDGMPDLAGVAAEVASVASDEDSGSASLQNGTDTGMGANGIGPESGDKMSTEDTLSAGTADMGQLSKDYGTPEALDFTGSATRNLTSTGLTKDSEKDGDAKSKIERPNEPLIPAAPVPGSLGSVVSGPAKGTVVIPEEPEPAKPVAIAEPVAPVFEAEVAPEIPEELKMKVQDAPRPVEELEENVNNNVTEGTNEANAAAEVIESNVAAQSVELSTDASALAEQMMPGATPQPEIASKMSVVEMPELVDSISEMQLDAAAAKEAASAASRAASAASRAAAAAASAATEVAETVSDTVAAMSGVYVNENGATVPSFTEASNAGDLSQPMAAPALLETAQPMTEQAVAMPESVENMQSATGPEVIMEQAEAMVASVTEQPSGNAVVNQSPYNPFVQPEMNINAENAENTNMASAMAPDVLQPKSEVFSAEQPAPETEKKPKQIKKVSITTVILLGIFAAVATALAIIFFIQWQMGVQTPTVNTTPETPGTSTEPDEPIVEQQAVTEWACVAALDTTEMPNLDNLVDGNLSTTLTFDNDWLMVMQAKLTYNFIDESSAVAALPQFQLLTEIANATVNAEGLSPLASSYEMQGNSVIYTVWTDIQQALSAEGLTVDLPRDINGELVLDSETVANYFIGKGQSCWEVSVTEAENQGDMNNSGTETEENTTVDSGENAADGSGVDDGENTNNSSNEINNNTILEDSEN